MSKYKTLKIMWAILCILDVNNEFIFIKIILLLLGCIFIHLESQVFSVKFLPEMFRLSLELLCDYFNKLIAVSFKYFVDSIGKNVHQCDGYSRKMKFYLFVTLHFATIKVYILFYFLLFKKRK